MALLADIKNITVHLNQKKIIEDVSFSIHKGQIIGLVGPNGGGKSTILKVLLGLLKPSSGKVILANDLTFGYLPQRPPNSFELPITVNEALAIFQATTTKAQALLKQLALSHILASPLRQLSGGELQKVFLTIALAQNPDLLLLDEPSANIDTHSDIAFRELLQQEKAQGKSIVIVSHDVDSIIQLTDEILCLNQRVCCYGKTSFVIRSQEFQELFHDQHYHHHHE
ncbi:MAG: metal ABC transporter ATP-binding protein [Candidatus Abawacabacteria bacterium]|nr:metal ABC transporter ATP-binding protein [Candidatus Abawacabacteria bacterium]